MKRKLIFLASQNLSCCLFSFTKLFQMNTFEGIPLEYTNSVCEIERFRVQNLQNLDSSGYQAQSILLGKNSSEELSLKF